MQRQCIQLDVVEPYLEASTSRGSSHRDRAGAEIGVAEQAVVVESHFGVESDQPAVAGQHAGMISSMEASVSTKARLECLEKWCSAVGGFSRKTEAEASLRA